MKTHLSLISLAILTSLYANNAFSSGIVSGCTDGCTKTETIDETNKTHKIVIDGDKNKVYSYGFDGLQSDKKYYITNHLHLENFNYKIYVPERSEAISVDITNHGKLITDGTSRVTSAIDAQWGNITEKLHVTNYGEIRTEGTGSNECAICSSYYKRNEGVNGRIKTPTDVVYEINNLGKDALISANVGPAIWLNNGKSTKITNEGLITSKSTQIPTIAIGYTNNAEVKNSGDIKSNGYAIFIPNATNAQLTNSGNIESADPAKTIISLTGESLSLINTGNIGFINADSSKANLAIRLNSSKKSELILKSGSKIDGIVKANPNNSSLILEDTGEETGLIHNKNKFQDFATFIMRGDQWTLSGPFEFKETVNAESGKLLLKEGSLTAPNIQLNANAALHFLTDYTLAGTTNNQGNLIFEHQEPVLTFKNLTINGDYQGQNGVLHLFADFNGTTNQTDKLRIQGNATGKTRVAINHIGNGEENAVNDVKIIETNTSTDSAFVIDQYLSKGAFVYNLEKRHENNQDNWYLTSYVNGIPTYRPEMASYANNIYAANHLFNLRLEDRLARHNFLNQSTGQELWLRLVEGTTRNQMEDKQNETKAQRYVVQLGSDLINIGNYKMGAILGYAKQNSKTQSLRAGISRAKTQGYSVGIYNTWYQNAENASGLYVDSWLQYQWFKNQVTAPDLQREHYYSRGLSASLEAGYTLPLVQYQVADWQHRLSIQPQTQFIWQGVRAKQYVDQQGTVINSLGHNNLQTRLGMKLSLDSHLTQQQLNLKPYIEFNWLHNSKAYGVTMDGVVNHIQGTKHLMEYKAGIESQVNDLLQVWVNTTHRRGQQGFKDNQLNLGVKVLF